MKLKIDKIIEILIKIKDDNFYFKTYSKQIIESYRDEFALEFSRFKDPYSVPTFNSTGERLYSKDGIDFYNRKELLKLFKKSISPHF